MQEEDRIAAAAARWQARLTGGAADARDHAAFAAWRAADPRHAAAAADMAALWHSAAPRTDRRRTRRLALAGGLVAAAAAGFAILPRRIEDWRADHVTAIGERRDILLVGGVRASLNTDTALAVTPESLQLLRGEAFFTVPDGPSLTVTTAALTVRATAAAFGVAAGGARDGVQVAAGLAQVLRPGAATLPVPAGAILHATAAAAEPADPLALLWRQGVLAFRRQRLEAVAAELDRYRQGRILIPSAALRAREVSGSLSLARPEAAVAALAGLFGLRVAVLPAGLILLREA